MRGRYCAVHPQVQRKRHKTAILQCPSSSRWDSHCGPVSKLEPWRAPEPTTLFMQYKHSGLASRTSDVAVSTMNSEVSKLHNRLKKARVAGSKVDFLVGDKPHRRRRCGSRLFFGCAKPLSRSMFLYLAFVGLCHRKLSDPWMIKRKKEPKQVVVVVVVLLSAIDSI